MEFQALQRHFSTCVEAFLKDGSTVPAQQSLKKWLNANLSSDVDENIELCHRLLGLAFIVKFPHQAKKPEWAKEQLAAQLHELERIFTPLSDKNVGQCLAHLRTIRNACLNSPRFFADELVIYRFIRRAVGNSSAAYDFALSAYQIAEKRPQPACALAAVSLDLGLIDDCKQYLRVATDNNGSENGYIKNVRIRLEIALGELEPTAVTTMVSMPPKATKSLAMNLARSEVDQITTRLALQKELVKVTEQITKQGPNTYLTAKQVRIISRLRNWNHGDLPRVKMSQVNPDLIQGLSPYLHNCQNMGIVYTVEDVRFYHSDFLRIATAPPKRWHFIPTLCRDDLVGREQHAGNRLSFDEYREIESYYDDFDFREEMTEDEDLSERETDEMFAFDEKEGHWTSWDHVD